MVTQFEQLINVVYDFLPIWEHDESILQLDLMEVQFHGLLGYILIISIDYHTLILTLSGQVVFLKFF